jgi:amino acid transporter/nucleotide-binding universal stress UspA family protein
LVAGDTARETVEIRLRRDLGLLEVVMIGLGPTIGTTIFLLVGPGIAIAGPALLLAFGLNFVVTSLTAMSYAELSSALPETGGGYLWIKTALPDPVGFLGGWMSWFGHCIVGSFYVLSFGVGAVWLADAAGYLADWSTGDRILLARLLAVAVLAAFVFVNYRGTQSTGASSRTVTLVLVAIVLAYVVLGLASAAARPGAADVLTPFWPGASSGEALLTILMAMGFTFIVFQGYEIIAQCGEECRKPERTIPRANLIVLTLATTIFVLVAFVTLMALEGTLPDDTERAVAVAAERFLPGLGLELIVAGVILGSLAALNSLVFSASRVSFAMGRDGALPKAFGRLHSKRITPHVATFASGLVMAAFVLGLDVIRIAASADVMFLLLFVLVNLAALRLRPRLPKVPGNYRAPLFPVTPVAALALNGILAVAVFLVDPAAVWVGLGWIVLGLGVHYVHAKGAVIAEAAAPLLETIVPAASKRYRVVVTIENFANTPLVDFGSLVARVEDARLILFHVVEVPDPLPLTAIEPSYRRDVQRKLARLARRARGVGVDVRARAVLSHRVVDAILDEVVEDRANLLVTGWRGTWRTGRILGSVVDRLVQSAPCDVIVFKTAGMKKRLERILVFNAPEWHVSYATNYAILLAKQHGARVTIFSAVKRKGDLPQERAYAARLAAMCRTHDVPFDQRFAVVTDIVDAVVEASRDQDLLILGAAEEWSRLQFAFGAVQDQIARRTPTPVLMVRKVRSRPLPGPEKAKGT